MQEFSEQAASTIIGLISTESNSESEACEVEYLNQQSNQACSKYLNECTTCFSNYHLRIFSRDFQIPLIYSQVSIMSNSMVFSDFKESIKACDFDN
jgi:hypothetical protein